MRILVVDDDRSTAYLLATMVSSFGCEVQVASQGKDAVQMAEDWQPEIVLLDLLLPDLDGFEVGRQLRQKFPNTKIVAITGLASSDERIHSAGFDAFLVKPVLVESLKQLLLHYTVPN